MLNIKVRRSLALTAGLTALGGYHSQAAAQEADQVSQSVGPQIEEIIVTAQRRGQALNDVPIAVTALTSDTLSKSGMNDLHSLSNATPNLNITHGSAAPNFFLRGIGNTSIAAGQEPSVALYVDGVYYAATFASVFSFNNIQRVEILSGPQGTLFGRNAMGGVIQVVTRDPTQDLTLELQTGYGNYDTVTFDGYISTGLGSNLAADIAVQISDQGKGWGTNLFNGKDVNLAARQSIRSKWLWDIGPDTSLTASVNYFHTRSDIGEASQVLPNVPVLPPSSDSVDFSGSIYNSYTNFPSFSNLKQVGGSLRLSHDFSFARLVTISAYQNVFGNTDLTLQPGFRQQIALDQGAKSYSQEVQFLSRESSPVQWVAGLYYFNSAAKLDPMVIGVGPALTPVLTVDDVQKTRSIAGFAQATFPIFDKTNLTLGARYTRDARSLVGLINGAPFAFKKSWGAPTYRIALDHKFNDDILAYASVSTGFKSGLFNATSPLQAPVDPEKLLSFEMGLKASLLDRRLQINTSAFHYKYDNIQLVKIIGVGTVLQNAAAAKITGIEVQGEAVLTQGLSLRFGGSLQDAHYTNFPDAAAAIPGPNGINVPTLVNASGKQMLRTPKATLNLAMAYERDFNFGKIASTITYYHNSGFPWDPDGRLRQEAYSLVNASLSWSDSDDRYTVQLWANNLLDKEYYNVQASAANAPDTGSAASPRTYGVRLKFKY